MSPSDNTNHDQVAPVDTDVLSLQQLDAWAYEYGTARPEPEGVADTLPNVESSCEKFDPENPPGNRLRCFAEDGQLLIRISLGSNELVRWLGVVTFVWLAMVAAFIAYEVLAEGAHDVVGIVVLVTALVGGLATLGHWIRARFGTMAILVDSDRIVVKSTLLGITWYKEYVLTSFSMAKLVVAHTRNGDPIYAVSVATTDKRPQFGAFLRQDEKEWLVRRINRFLGCNDGAVTGTYIDPNPTGMQWTLMGGFQFFDE